MRCFLARMGGVIYSGGWQQCINWGLKQVDDNHSAIIKVFRARGGEKDARVVCEITEEGIRLIHNGRYVRVRKLQEAANGKV